MKCPANELSWLFKLWTFHHVKNRVENKNSGASRAKKKDEDVARSEDNVRGAYLSYMNCEYHTTY